MRLVLQEIELEGFKSFRDSTCIGPLGDFTAVVGPNGCGKSVVGEAVAWVLGGSKRMLRAKNLASLINCERRAAGCATATVTCKFVPRAVVEPPVLGTPAGNGTTPGPDANGPVPAALSIRKTLRDARSSIHVRTCSADEWTMVTQAQLQALLLQHGIQTEMVDRYIVTQTQTAVDAQEPVQLAARLEVLVGTDGYAERIAERDAAVTALARQACQLEQEMSRLEGRRAELAPLVQRWRQHERASVDLRRRKRRILGTQLRLLTDKLSSLDGQVKDAAAAEAQAALRDADAQQRVRHAEAQLRQLERRVDSTRKGHATASAQACKLSLQAAEVAEGMKQAQRQAKAGASLLSKLESQLAVVSQQQQELAAHQGKASQRLQAAQSEHDAAEDAWVQLGGRHAGDAAATITVQLATAEDALANAAARCERLEGVAASAAARHADARERNATREAAAAAAEQRVADGRETARVASAELTQAQAAEQEALTAWRASQEALLALQAEQDVLQSSSGASGNPAAPSGAGCQQTDAAVLALKAMSDARSIPGRFYGRLCNVALVSDAAAAVAVNTVLQEVAGLDRTLIVSTRETAAVVISYYRAHHVGRTTCRILDQLHHQQPPADDLATARSAPGGASAADELLTPLAALVEPADGCQEVRPLLLDLLGSWRLAKTREAAVRHLQACGGARRAYSIATRQGELFKADGEIVGSAAPAPVHAQSARTPAYGLRTQVQLLRPSTAPPLAGCGVASLAAGASGDDDGVRALQQLRVCADKAQAALHECAALLVDRRAQAASQQAAAAAAARRVAAGERELGALRAPRACTPLQMELQAAQSFLEQAQGELARARGLQGAQQRDVDQLRQRLQLCAGLSDSRQGSALDAAKRRLEAAAAAMADVQDEERAVGQALARLGRQAGALQAELGRLCGQPPAPGGELQAQHTKLLQRAAHQQARAEKAAEQLVSQQLERAAQRKAVQSCGKVHAATAAELAAAQAALRRAQGALASVQMQQEHTRASLELLEGDVTDVEPGMPAAGQQDAVVESENEWDGGSAKRRCRSLATVHCVPQAPVVSAGASSPRTASADGAVDVMEADEPADGQVPRGKGASSSGGTSSSSGSGGSGADDGSSDDEDGGSDGDSAFEGSARELRRRQAPPLRRRRPAQQVRASSSDSEDGEGAGRLGGRGGVRRRAWAPGGRAAGRSRGGDAAWVAREVDALAAEEARLAKEAAALDADAVREDAAAEARLRQAGDELAGVEESQLAESAECERLWQQRFDVLCGSLCDINRQLSCIYQQLTGGTGDACLSYTLERRLLFSEGVLLHVRPGGLTRWRGFRELSGGQKALAALALSFALQACHPSPFFFFDEIDAALDAGHAARVADYILRHVAGPGAAQYLCVSHKPEMFERASCLLGLYSLPGGASSAAAVARF